MAVVVEFPGSRDLPSRLRRVIAEDDTQELELLDPIVRGLAQWLLRLAEIENLDAEVATRLAFAREKASHARHLRVVGRA